MYYTREIYSSKGGKKCWISLLSTSPLLVPVGFTKEAGERIKSVKNGKAIMEIRGWEAWVSFLGLCVLLTGVDTMVAPRRGETIYC